MRECPSRIVNSVAYVQLDDLSLSFGDRTIFSGVQLTVSPGSRIALTGANGSGKSTLMKSAAGMIEYDSGRIITPKGTRIAYLPQSGIVHKGKSLRDEAMMAFEELMELERESESLAESLERGEGDQKGLLSRYQFIRDTLDHAEWDLREGRIHRILMGLGFRKEELDHDVSTFSGGWQMRIALAKILLESPDLLFLDEPTNYLDLEAREWLGDFIKRYPGGVMLVSHDRSFLDETCKEVAEILMAKVSLFKGSYSGYESFQEKEMAALLERWKRQQEEISRIETFINRFRYKESKAIQVQSRIKMLEKIDRIEIPPTLKRIRFTFPPAPHSGKVTLRGTDLSRRYGGKTVFSHLDLELPRGSRTAVVGLNGAGKTTLLRIISGEDREFDGELALGSGVKRGYFSQDQEAVLDPELTVIEEAGKGSDEGEARLRSLLGAFLFSEDDIHKKVAVLSGGERNRLALLKILLEPVNFLILDEPTNHLDITSKDILLEALADFGGTLVIVSHDRYFLERIADQVLEIEGGGGRTYWGDYAYYRWRKAKLDHESTAGLHQKILETNSPDANEAEPKNTTLSREDQKRQRSLVNKLKKEEERLTASLEESERKAASIRSQLELPENYSNPEKAHSLSAELLELKKQIEQILSAWESSATALEEAKRKASG